MLRRLFLSSEMSLSKLYLTEGELIKKRREILRLKEVIYVCKNCNHTDTGYLENRSVSHGRSRGATSGVFVDIAAIYIIRLYSLVLCYTCCVKIHS